MDRFVSNITLRLDAKGRVSIPAAYRGVLARDGFEGLYVYPTLDRPALDAGGNALLAEIEQDALYRREAEFARDGIEIGEIRLDQRQPSAGTLDEIRPESNRRRIAVGPENLHIAGREHGAGMPARPEGRVDIDAALAHRQELDGRRTEHGNVRGRSASDSRLPGVAAHHHSRAPCGSSAAIREPNCFLSARTFPVASASCARKRSGSQI